jgi:hypothetical protein
LPAGSGGNFQILALCLFVRLTSQQDYGKSDASKFRGRSVPVQKSTALWRVRIVLMRDNWKTTSVFHRYAIVDHQDIANAMEMLERSQDEQRRRSEAGLVAKAERPLPNNVGSQKSAHQSTTPASSEKSALTSR